MVCPFCVVHQIGVSVGVWWKHTEKLKPKPQKSWGLGSEFVVLPLINSDRASKLLVKIKHFTIFPNQFQIALETVLWHTISCYGYVTCSPWSKEYVENILRPLTCMKTFFGRKTRKDGSFCNLILTPKGVCSYQKCSKNC